MNSKPEQNTPPEGDAIIEPGEATVDDWFGQDLERDAEDAERALELAGGDETRAEEVFEEIRRSTSGCRRSAREFGASIPAAGGLQGDLVRPIRLP